MKKTDNYQLVWQKITPLLKKARKKDFILHTKNVVRAMKLLLKEEKVVNEEVVILAAYLHDVGWSEVNSDLQLSENKKDQLTATKQHIKFAPVVIDKILNELKYDKNKIKTIQRIVVSHKFSDPKDIESQLLIDADTLSDTFPDSFKSDTRSYKTTLENLYCFRRKNKFYTKTAQKIFEQHLINLKKKFLLKCE